MSLAEAVEAVAEGMDETIADLSDDPASKTFVRILRSFARELRTAVKASGGIPNPPQITMIPQAQHAVMIEQERMKIRAQKAVENRPDDDGPAMALCVGGENDNTTIPCDPTMPVGARTLIGKEVYQKQQNGQLKFDKMATEGMKG